ncbi:MAG: hypothetical protein KC613_09940 [Myxococcales bacterium]|nr:hypothetical protein [Myxococcales bacterium]MCB9525636.1 hypothetical protein [Myxococcales bacterium]
MRAALRGAALALALALGGSGCGETAGRPIAVPAAARGAAEGGGPVVAFTNAQGWRVALTEAHALLGPIYFDEVAADAFGWLRRLLPVGTAHAHVLATGGTTLGEVLHQVPVDLLAADGVPLGDTAGQLGTCRRMEVQLLPLGAVALAPGADVAPLRGHALWAAGTAEKDGVTVRFAAGLDLPEDPALRRITDIKVADVRFDDRLPGGPRVVVRVEDWFWQADFGTLPPADEDGLTPIPADSPVARGWLRAATHAGTYDLEWTP